MAEVMVQNVAYRATVYRTGVKGSIITEMSIPWLLTILGDAIKQDVLLFTMLW